MTVLMIARLTGMCAVASVVLFAGPAVAGAAVAPNVKRVLADYRDDGRIDPCNHSAKDLRDTLKAVTAGTEQYAPDFPAAVEAALEARTEEGCDDQEETGNEAPDGDGAGGAGTPPAASATPSASPAPTASPTPAASSTPSSPSSPSSTAPTAPSVPSQPVPEAPAPPGAGITPGVPPPADNRPDVVLTRPVPQSVADDMPLIVLAALLAASLLAGLLLLAMQRFGWGEHRLAGARHAWGEAGYRTGGTWQDFKDWVRFGR